MNIFDTKYMQQFSPTEQQMVSEMLRQYQAAQQSGNAQQAAVLARRLQPYSQKLFQMRQAEGMQRRQGAFQDPGFAMPEESMEMGVGVPKMTALEDDLPRTQYRPKLGGMDPKSLIPQLSSVIRPKGKTTDPLDLMPQRPLLFREGFPKDKQKQTNRTQNANSKTFDYGIPSLLDDTQKDPQKSPQAVADKSEPGFFEGLLGSAPNFDMSKRGALMAAAQLFNNPEYVRDPKDSKTPMQVLAQAGLGYFQGAQKEKELAKQQAAADALSKLEKQKSQAEILNIYSQIQERNKKAAPTPVQLDEREKQVRAIAQMRGLDEPSTLALVAAANTPNEKGVYPPLLDVYGKIDSLGKPKATPRQTYPELGQDQLAQRRTQMTQLGTDLGLKPTVITALEQAATTPDQLGKYASIAELGNLARGFAQEMGEVPLPGTEKALEEKLASSYLKEEDKQLVRTSLAEDGFSAALQTIKVLQEKKFEKGVNGGFIVQGEVGKVEPGNRIGSKQGDITEIIPESNAEYKERVGAAETVQALDTLIDVMAQDYTADDFGRVDKFLNVFESDEEYAQFAVNYTQILMSLKDTYALGAITGPDLDLLQNIIKDPRNLTTGEGYYQFLTTAQQVRNNIYSKYARAAERYNYDADTWFKDHKAADDRINKRTHPRLRYDKNRKIYVPISEGSSSSGGPIYNDEVRKFGVGG
jgi:hypothetical protein